MAKLTVEEKFAKAIIRLRNIRPFYAAIYETLEKVRKDSVGTIGVSTNKLVYNYDYIDKAEFAEFMFMILHEVAHVALMHVVRMENKDHYIFNIAADMFVNKLLYEEFQITPGTKNQSLDIQMTRGAVFEKTVDTQVDIVEEIYANLVKQLEPQGYFSDTSETKEYKVELSKTPQIMSHELIISRKMATDLVDDGSDYTKKDDECRKVLVEARTRFEMNNSNAPGSVPGRLSEFVDKLLESKIDWRKLLRKYCIQYRTQDVSFSTPDKRMYYQNAIYPGIHSESDETIKNVKVCIDTSGSISKEDLGHFFTQIMQLVKTFKTSVEVLDWDTEVENIYQLTKSTIEGCKEHKVVGRGGTNPTCLFEYFDSNKCRVKPFVVLVFTDGYIDMTLKDKWLKTYKNTIWIMTKDYNPNFTPPFGKLAFAKFND